MIINAKWWEETENIATMVQFLAHAALDTSSDSPYERIELLEQALRQIAVAVEEPIEYRELFVRGVLADADVIICRCGECGGKEWNVGSKLIEHFVDLLDRGRSLNFVEPQEEEAV